MNRTFQHYLITPLFFLLGCTIQSEVPATNLLETQSPAKMATNSPTPLPALSPSNTPEPTQIVLPRWVKVFDSYIQGSIAADHIPGMAYALVLPDGSIHAKGYGYRDVAQELPVTPQTLFHIGSTQKSMNSMLIAALIDGGYFEWDTPVIEIYPDFHLSSSAYTQKVTMRHLLSMSSGIPDYAEDNLAFETASSEDVLEVVASTDLLYSPGGVFSYSNLSATIAGYAAGYAYSGGNVDLYKGYVDALSALVVQPIGMMSSTFSVTEARSREDFSYSYILPNGIDPQLARSYDIDEDPLAPAGTLKANVLELAAYISTQINRGLAPNGNRIVSEENLIETWHPVLEGYALGWDNLRYNSRQLIYHTGSFDNYVSVMAFLPDMKVGLVILVNSEDAGYYLTEDAPYNLTDILRENGL